jgi:hypothetical protein
LRSDSLGGLVFRRVRTIRRRIPLTKRKRQIKPAQLKPTLIASLPENSEKRLLNDKSLSTLAHNIRVDAQNGVVILQGFVRSEEEKNTIDSKATEIAGAANVKDELKVKTKE